jgi:hypothetical protein
MCESKCPHRLLFTRASSPGLSAGARPFRTASQYANTATSSALCRVGIRRANDVDDVGSVASGALDAMNGVGFFDGGWCIARARVGSVTGTFARA